MTRLQIEAIRWRCRKKSSLRKLQDNLIYSIRILDAMTKPELTEIDRSRLAAEALDQIQSNIGVKNAL